MADNYIGANGLVTQTLEEIKTALIAQFKGIYGNNINLEQNSPDGQFINLLAQEKKDTLDFITQLYNNLDVDAVYGLPQQILYKLNGLTIHAYTYSYVYITVVVSESVTLQGLDDNINNADGTGYTVRDTNGNRWILAETQNLTAGSYTLNFRAAELGAITALPNTINVMETVLKGVTLVNNTASNYQTGNEGETAAQYRQRRNRAMSVPSQGFSDSIESQMLNLQNVSQCKVYENKTNSVDSDGIPAHGFWVIVEGGTTSEIGNIIYRNAPPGIPMKGTQSVVITKQNGSTETVYYDLPSPATLYIAATITAFDGTLDDDYIKEQLVSQLDYNIGQMADSAILTTILKDIIGEMGTVYGVEVSADNNTFAEYLTPTGKNKFWQVTTSSITLTEV